MEEFNRGRVTTVFTTDTELDVGAGDTAELASHFYELTNAGLVDLSEGIVFVDLLVIVSGEELTSVVTAEAESHLSKVVSSETEEVCLLSDFISSKTCSWNFDHSTYFIFKLYASSSDNCVSSSNNSLFNKFKFLNFANERNHNFRNDIPFRVTLRNSDSSLDNSLSLHFCNFRISYGKTATSVTHHWVEFVKTVTNHLDFFNSLTLSGC